MPEWVAETLKYVGPFGVFCIAMCYLLMRDRSNQRPVGNPGTPLADGQWQQEMRDAQLQATAALKRIEKHTEKAATMLTAVWVRMGGDPPPEV